MAAFEKKERQGAGKAKHMAELLQHLAAEFLNRESNRTSLITVTNIDLASDLGNAVIFFTVLPKERTDAALDFLKRRRSDFRDYVRSHAKLKRIPRFDFEVDRGELNRQHIDNLIQQ